MASTPFIFRDIPYSVNVAVIFSQIYLRPSQTEAAPAHGVRLLLCGCEQMPSPSVTMCGGGTDSRSRWGLWVGHQLIPPSAFPSSFSEKRNPPQYWSG